MRKSLKKLTALLCSAALVAGAVPGIVLAEDSAEHVVYSEDFESGDAMSSISNRQNGWNTGGDDGATHFNVGNYNDDTGRDSHVLRQAVTDWWKWAYSNLYLYDNGVYKAKQKGMSQADAEEWANTYLSGNMTISMKANFAVPNPEQSGDSYIRIKDNTGNTIVGINVRHTDNESTGFMRIENILNDEQTASSTKEVMTGMDISDKNKNWYDIKFSIDKDNLKVKVDVDEYTSGWMPIGNNDKSGAAESIGRISEIESGVYWGAWWQSMFIDDITITSTAKEPVITTEARILNEDNSPVIYGGDKVHSKVSAQNESAKVSAQMSYTTDGESYVPIDENGTLPYDAEKMKISVTAEADGTQSTKEITINVGKDDNTLENVNFDNRGQIQEWANANKVETESGFYNSGSNGWGTRGNGGTHAEGSEDDGGTFRIANDGWYQQSWLDHSFSYAETERLRNEGASEPDAAREAAENLSNNVTVSLKARFDNTNGDDKNQNRAFINILDNNGKTIASLYHDSQKKDKDGGGWEWDHDALYLIAMNADGTGLEKIPVTAFEEKKWHNIKFDFNNDTDKFRCTIDGEVIQTSQGEWTDVADNSVGADGGLPEGAAKYDFGAVDKLTVGLWWTNWWQQIHIDDINVTPMEYEIADEITGGTASYTRGKNPAETAAGGNKVTLTLSPAEDKKAEDADITVTGESGANIPVTEKGGGKYTFIMPREKVTVNAALKDKNSPVEETPTPTEAPPVVTKAPGEAYYTEDFENDEVRVNVAMKYNGWNTGGDESKTEFGVEPHDDTGNSSKTLRVAVNDWWKWAYANLYLSDNGVYKMMLFEGVPEQEAIAAVNQYLSGSVSVKLRANFAVPNPEQAGEDYIRIKDDAGNTLAGISVKRENDEPTCTTGTMYLNNILGEERVIMTGFDISEHNTNWYNFRFDIDRENLKIRVVADDFATEWLPIGNADKTAPAESFGKINEIEFGVYNGAWWQSLYVDDVAVEGFDNSEIIPPTQKPTDEPKPTEEPGNTPEPSGKPSGKIYVEDFEDNAKESEDAPGKKELEIKNEQNGWTYDGGYDGDNHWYKEDVNIWVGDNGSGSDNALRYSNGDKWWSTTWLVLDLLESAKSKGADEQEMEQYLGGDMKVSFRAKFEVQGPDLSQEHKSKIRIKDNNQHVIAELKTINRQLGLVTNADLGDAAVFNPIGEVTMNNRYNDDGSLSDGWVSDWYTFDFNIDRAREVYTLSINGRPITINGQSEFATDMESGSRVASLEFDNEWAGWWQCLYVDDISVGGREEAPVREWDVKDFDIDSDGNFSFTVSAGNITYYDTEVVAALYDKDGVLQGTKVFASPKFNDDAEFSAEEKFDLPDDKTDLSVKIFVWRSGNLYPIANKAYEKNLSLS